MEPSLRLNLRGARIHAAVALMAVLAVAACSRSAAATPSAATPTASPAAVATPSTASSIEASSPASPSALSIKADAGAPDSKVVLGLVALKSAWTPITLIGPADKSWHLTVDQQDKNVPHNFTIASVVTTRPGDLAVDQRAFQSQQLVFGKNAVDVGGLPAGTYTFYCTIHPVAMIGTLTLK